MCRLTFGMGIALLLMMHPTIGAGQEVPDSTQIQVEDNLTKSSLDSTKQGDGKPGSKINPGAPSKFDWLKLFDGREMEVEVRRISEKYVFSSQPGVMETDWIDRREIQTIYYRTGGVEQMNSKQLDIKDTKDWQSIAITKNADDVVGFIKIDAIEVRFESKSRQHYRSAQALERSAEIVVMKQAAILNADVVLITKVSHIRAYGDAPVIIMAGEAYRKR